MSLANFTDLQASVARWAHRTDLTSLMADLVQLAEERIAKDLRLLEQVKSDTLTTTPDVAAVALPADWLEFARDGVKYGGERVDYATVEQLARYEHGPSYAAYSIQGTNLLLAPVSSNAESIAVTYYARVPALSVSNPTNWLLTKYPSIYLNACLIEAAIYADDEQAAGRWGALYNKAVEAAKSTDAASRTNGASLRLRMR